jgi:NAD(P)-dependent dehydrogenase (short-subunit alcohol dehydrogenase family)
MARIVVSGANRGIGLELVRQLAARGEEVIAACRTASPELAALDVDVHEGVELTDDASVAAFATAVSARPVDILVNNAGLLTNEILDDPDFDRMRRQYEVNTLAPLRLTTALLPAMGKGAKVVLVTSRVGSLTDNSSGGKYGYRM